MTFTAYQPVQQANDLAVNWNQINPTPKAAQICVEIDTLQFKIGNGVQAYRDLPFAGGNGSSSSSGYVSDGAGGAYVS